MSVQGIIVLLVLVALFSLAVVWISRNGGWQNGGCHGNCAECHSHCEEKPSQKDSSEK
jgi:cobalamin synthase